MNSGAGRIWAFRLGLIALTALVSLSIYWQVFSLFMLYDDEGYVLHSLNTWAREGALYDQVFSQYGPLYYLLAGGAARLGGFEWTHDLSRIVTGLAWLATALASGLLATKLSGSRWGGAIGFAASNAFVGQMAHEPMHPGNLLTPIIAWGTVASIHLCERGRPRSFAIVVALMAASCALIKINVGVFIAGAGGMWWWFRYDHPGVRNRGAAIIVVAMGAGFPALLMHRHLTTDWGATYAILSGIAISTAGGLLWVFKTPNPSRPAVFPALMAGLALGTVAVIGILTTGTSWQGLWQGMIAQPLQHADVYAFPPNWRPGTLICSLLSLAGFVIVLRNRLRSGDYPPGAKLVIFVIRAGLAVAFIWWTFALPSRSVGGVMTVMVGSLGWILLPLGKGVTPLQHARLWAGLLLAWQFLHAYPVAGTQLTWGLFLWIPILVAALGESLRDWLATARSGADKHYRYYAGSAALLALVLLVGNPLRSGHYYYHAAEPLQLPGARLLRVSPQAGSALRIVAANAALHAELLYSLPGAFSYNLWTHLPTPTTHNVTHWFSLLNTVKQQEIITRLETAGPTAWVVQPELLDQVLPQELDQTTPLLSYWKNNYKSALRIDGIELHLAHDPSAVMVNTATYYHALSPDDPHMVEVAVVLPAGTAVARVEIHTFSGGTVQHDAGTDWLPHNTTVKKRSVFPQGIPREGGEFTTTSWPISSQDLVQLRFYPRGPLPRVPLGQWWLKFIAPDGRILSEARFDMRPPTTS